MQRSRNMLPKTEKKVTVDEDRHRANRNVGINK